MKRKILIILAVVLAVASGLWLYMGRVNDRPSVQTAVITRGEIVKTVSATGSLNALNTVSVGAQVSGTIKKIHVDYNSVVKKGDLLAEIDPDMLRANLRQSEASVLSSSASLQEAQATLASAKRTLERNDTLPGTSLKIRRPPMKHPRHAYRAPGPHWHRRGRTLSTRRSTLTMRGSFLR